MEYCLEVIKENDPSGFLQVNVQYNPFVKTCKVFTGLLFHVPVTDRDSVLNTWVYMKSLNLRQDYSPG